MSTLDFLLAIVSFVSFGIAVWFVIRNNIAAAREEANVTILKERIDNLKQGLHLALQSTNAIVQIPKNKEVSAEELQNIARIARGQIILVLEGFEKQAQRLDSWQFGVLLDSKKWPESETKKNVASLSTEQSKTQESS